MKGRTKKERISERKEKRRKESVKGRKKKEGITERKETEVSSH